MQTNPSSPHSSELVGVARIFWIMIGPAVLVLLGMGIVTRGNGWFTPQDIAFLAVLGVVVAARWYEFHGGSPQTSTGEPATPAHLRRFVLCALTAGLGAWIVANLIGNYWLAG